MTDEIRFKDLERRVTALEGGGPPGGPGMAAEIADLRRSLKSLEGALAEVRIHVEELEDAPAVWNRLQSEINSLAAAVRRLEQGSGGTPMPGY